jgi:hypothetical protein
MVKFRPHIATLTIQGGDSVYDQETGEYTTVAETSIQFPCRATPNGAGRKIANQDGALVEYGYMVNAEKLDFPIPYGAIIEIKLGDEVKAKGKVIGSFENSMNTRIWL